MPTATSGRFSIPAAPLRYMRAGLSGPGASEALGWYADVLDGVETYLDRTGLPVPVETAVGVLSVTSPRVTVLHNARHTDAVLRRLAAGEDPTEAPGLLPSVRASLEHYLDTGRIRGPKTHAFARAIAGDTDAVVVDVWVQRGLGHEGEMRGRRYKRAAAVVRGLASRLGVSPREGQAALWYGARAAAGAGGGTSRLRLDAFA